MGVTDLNRKNHSGHAASSDIFGVMHVYRTVCFFPGYRPPSNAYVPALRTTQPGRAVRKNDFVVSTSISACAFAQLTYRESLRNIESCLRAHQSKRYHMGIRSRSVVRSTLSETNEQRD